MSMHCKGMEALLLAVTDGRATREQREQVAAHIGVCAACAQWMDAMRAVWTTLDQMEGLEPSAAFDVRLRARMAEQPVRSFWHGWLPAHLRLVAVVGALVAVAVWISLRSLTHRAPASAESQEDFAVVKNLPVLENYDVISNFDALSALPGAQTTTKQEQQQAE